MTIKKVGVVGSGAMGTGIAQITAQYGYEVVVYDLKEEIVEKSLERIEKVLSKLVVKEKIYEKQKEEILERITTTTDLEDMKDVDLVIEAVVENMDVKQDVFSNLDKICKDSTILASNTSTMSITKIATATERQDKFAGLHFFNPAPVMKLVEIIRGYYTDDETVAVLKEFVKSINKEGIEVKKDAPGFVVNRLMLPQFREAYLVYEEGVASLEDIDKAMKLGLNHPMGPFELMDYTGLDIAYDSLVYMYGEFAKPNWSPPPALKRMINANRLGMKTGKGWYDYDDKEKK